MEQLPFGEQTVENGTLDPARTSLLSLEKIIAETRTTSNESNFDRLVNAEHTRQLYDEVSLHGMSIVRGVVSNSPNEANFRQRHGLTQAEMNAIGFYRGSGAKDFNNLLRGEVRPILGRKYYDILLALFGENGRLPQTQGGEVLYRGLPTNASLTEPGFSSTSIEKRTGIAFANQAKRLRGSGVVRRLVLPPGIRYLPVGAGEKEVILQPGIQTQPLAFHEPHSPSYTSFTQTLSERSAAQATDGLVDCVVLVAGTPS